MVVTEELKKIIDDDIELCEEICSGSFSLNVFDVYMRLRNKYSNIITGFCDNLSQPFYDDDNSTKKANLETMRQKLLLFKAMGYKNYSDYDVDNSQQPQIAINNISQNTVSIEVTFNEVRKRIENMSSLPDVQIEEILSKIDELEKIVNSGERKTKKWEQAKDIVKWVADKGVDVGMTLLPLILRIGK